MEKYVYSGAFTQKMIDKFLTLPEFEPMDILTTQVDRSGVKQAIRYIEQGAVKSFLLDSGAFSFHRSGIQLDEADYINFANSIDKYCWGIVQVDHIPGKLGQPKTSEDYKESAKLSWEQYLSMRPKMKSPEKLVYVFHHGEDFEHLKMVLDWRDPVDGSKIEIIGCSPANDRAQSDKNIFIGEFMDVVKASSNPDVKVHAFGMTSHYALLKYPLYSADSISHRSRTGYAKLYTRKWGTISVSDKTRTNKSKSNMSFLKTCDEQTYKEFEELVNGYGFTIDEIINENYARVVVDVMEVQKFFKENNYKPENRVRSKRLF